MKKKKQELDNTLENIGKVLVTLGGLFLMFIGIMVGATFIVVGIFLCFTIIGAIIGIPLIIAGAGIIITIFTTGTILGISIGVKKGIEQLSKLKKRRKR